MLDVVREMLFLLPVCQMQLPAQRDLGSVVQRDFNMYLCAAFTVDENFPYLLLRSGICYMSRPLGKLKGL